MELLRGADGFWEVSVGVDAGWPKKQRLNYAGDYSSSGGSHELPDDALEFPSPPSFTPRTRRLVKGQRNGLVLGESPRSLEV